MLQISLLVGDFSAVLVPHCQGGTWVQLFHQQIVNNHHTPGCAEQKPWETAGQPPNKEIFDTEYSHTAM